MLTKKIQPEGQADESQRQGPLKLQGCYNHPHHPHPPRASMTTTILPLLPDHLRRQLLAEQARLLEMARSVENNQGERPREVSLSRRN